MTFEERSNIVLEQAKTAAIAAVSWDDFGRIMFDQKTGLVCKSFPDDEERRKFFFTKQSNEIDDISLALMKKFGLAARGIQNEVRTVVSVDCTSNSGL